MRAADKLIEKLRERATIKLTVEPENIPVEGNACACGEPDCDDAHIRPIIEAVESGDPWAWCQVYVEAEYGGFKGGDSLGGCSYRDEKDFRAPGGYFEDMVENALEQLAREIESARVAIENLEE